MDDLRGDFAPKGVMRVALNHGNRVLVSRDAQGLPKGITVDIGTALAAFLSVRMRFVDYQRAVDVSESADLDEWDVCFLAIDPDRGLGMDFTHPYVQIEGCYLAGPRCVAADSTALVSSGAPVGTVRGSAYTLTLNRLPGAQNLVIFEDITAALKALDQGRVDAVAGIGSVMRREAESRPGARVLAPAFMTIRQAMAMPKGRPEAVAALGAFLADLTRRGITADILEVHGVDRSCAVAPPP